LRAALVGQLAAVEIGSPLGSARMAATARRLGLPAVEAFYAEHEVADSVHEHVMRHDVIGGLLEGEPHLREDVVFGLRAHTFFDDALDRLLVAAWSAGTSSLRAGLP
jgi:hypothetical protein